MQENATGSMIKKSVWFRGQLNRLFHSPLGLLGLVLVVTIVLSALLADWIMPHDPKTINVKYRLQPPSVTYPLGTDQLGRDVLSRVIMGSRIALKVAVVSISISMVLGLTMGLLAGYGPPWLDRLMIIQFDTIRSFPVVMFALAVVTIVGPSLNTVILVIIVTSIPIYGRITRAQTQTLKNSDFIMAEVVMGAGMTRILVIHILPNVIGPLLIIASMEIPAVVTLEAGLSFLGLGVRPPTPSWGSILNDGFAFIRETPWLVIAAGIPLILTTLGFTFLGETLRDLFDPKLQKEL